MGKEIFQTISRFNHSIKRLAMTTQEIIELIEQRERELYVTHQETYNSRTSMDAYKLHTLGAWGSVSSLLDEIKQRMEQPTRKVEVLNGMQKYFKEKNLL